MGENKGPVLVRFGVDATVMVENPGTDDPLKDDPGNGPELSGVRRGRHRQAGRVLGDCRRRPRGGAYSGQNNASKACTPLSAWLDAIIRNTPPRSWLRTGQIQGPSFSCENPVGGQGANALCLTL